MSGLFNGNKIVGWTMLRGPTSATIAKWPERSVVPPKPMPTIHDIILIRTNFNNYDYTTKKLEPP